jgi:hypothetical protein
VKRPTPRLRLRVAVAAPPDPLLLPAVIRSRLRAGVRGRGSEWTIADAVADAVEAAVAERPDERGRPWR